MVLASVSAVDLETLSSAALESGGRANPIAPGGPYLDARPVLPDPKFPRHPPGPDVPANVSPALAITGWRRVLRAWRGAGLLGGPPRLDQPAG